MFSVIIQKFLTPYLTYIKLGVVAAVVLAMAWLYAEVAHYKGEVAEREAQITVLKTNMIMCVGANEASTATIAELKKERSRTVKTCNTIQAGYDAALAELVRIDGLTGGAHEHNGEDSVTGGSGDGLLDSLNGLFPDLWGTEGRGANGVCQAGSPGDAQSADILPGSVRYCFCNEQDVKNLLKNLVLKSGREAALVTIIEGQR